MRLSFPPRGLLCGTAVVLLGSWMAVTTVGVLGRGGFQLQVPASYLSVGQQFQPRLVSLALSTDLPPSPISLELDDAQGRAVATQQFALNPTGTALGTPLALPGPGAYTLRARSPRESQSIALHALPEPNAGYGGVLAVASAGLPPGAADYLRQHGFAVTEMSGAAPSDPPSLILIGDARLDGAAVATQYRWIWKQVDLGAQAVLLETPPPGAAAYWPISDALAPAAGKCAPTPDSDPPLYYGVQADASLRAMLAPAFAFSVPPAQPGYFAWNGTPLSAAGGADCESVFSVRYGEGWITVSTLPLLQHFQDVRARLVLMNLIKAAALRKRAQQSADLLARSAAARLAALPAVDAGADQAIFFSAPPSEVESSGVLVPLAGGACWRAPVMLEPGASVLLDLRRPQPVHSLELHFGPGGDGRPVSFTLAASVDGFHWIKLADPPFGRDVSVALPPGNWRAIRLDLPVPTSAWQLCGFSAH